MTSPAPGTWRVVGVDLGKTGCRARLGPAGPQVEGPGAAGLADPGGVEQALAAVRRVLDGLTSDRATPVTSLCVGAAGAEAAPREAHRLARLLAREHPAARVAVVSDSVTAHAGALGGAPGSVLAVGTGAVALGLAADGTRRQVDGWGPWLGDDGGGAWIGRAALRAVLRHRDGRGESTALTAAAVTRYGDLGALPRTLAAGATARSAAAFVPDVLVSAAGGDVVAVRVLSGAVEAWADLALAAMEAAGVPTLALVGGLSGAPALVESFAALLPATVDLRPALGTSLDGAVLLGTRDDLAHEASVLRVDPEVRMVAAAPTDVDVLATEQVRPDLADLDARSPDGLVDVLLEAEATVPAALAATRQALAEAVRLGADALARGGRLVYVGAGTPGRLAALDAAECPPTYGVAPDRVVAVCAGGEVAARTAVEGAEDDAGAGAADVGAIGVGPTDLVVGISASGRTPYVLAALAAARTAGAATVAVVNNPGSPVAAAADVAVEALTGPEVLGGSTRLKAGTAQKIALNVISTGAMVSTGRTYGAWMVDVTASNEKLRRRARRILREATGVDDATALTALEDARWQTKTALVHLLADVPVGTAQRLLDAHAGHVRPALAAAAADLEPAR